MVGKYVDLKESYKSLNEALTHAGIHTQTRVRIRYIDSEQIEADGTELLADLDAILVPGGFGSRGIEGKILAVQYARERKVPYLGICLGMQVAVIEFARHIAGLEGASSTEFDRDTPHPRWAPCLNGVATRAPTSAARCAWALRNAGLSLAAWRTGYTAAT